MFFKTGWPYFIVLLPPDKDKKAQTVHNETFKFRLRQGLKKIHFSTLGTIGIIFFHCFSPHFNSSLCLHLYPSHWGALCQASIVWCRTSDTQYPSDLHTHTHTLCRAYCCALYPSEFMSRSFLLPNPQRMEEEELWGESAENQKPALAAVLGNGTVS